MLATEVAKEEETITVVTTTELTVRILQERIRIQTVDKALDVLEEIV